MIGQYMLFLQPIKVNIRGRNSNLIGSFSNHTMLQTNQQPCKRWESAGISQYTKIQQFHKIMRERTYHTLKTSERFLTLFRGLP